jgi:hypothetical protein
MGIVGGGGEVTCQRGGIRNQWGRFAGVEGFPAERSGNLMYFFCQFMVRFFDDSN